MNDLTGQVTVNERAPNPRFHRFVDESIRDWLRENDIDDHSTEYQVSFFDEDPLGEVSCMIVLQSGENLWRSWETADNPRIAFRRSLDQMRVEVGLEADESAPLSEKPRSARDRHH